MRYFISRLNCFAQGRTSHPMMKLSLHHPPVQVVLMTSIAHVDAPVMSKLFSWPVLGMCATLVKKTAWIVLI
jgi:hypothetical protein